MSRRAFRAGVVRALGAAVTVGALALAFAAVGPAPAFAQDPPELTSRLDAIDEGLSAVEAEASAGRADGARTAATRIYLDQVEVVEGWYGPGAPLAVPTVAPRVAALEEAFHALMSADDAGLAAAAARARERTAELRSVAAEAPVAAAGAPAISTEGGVVASADDARTEEIAAILARLDRAEAAWRSGDSEAALRDVEHAYLEGLEQLEPRLPSELVGRAERLVHLVLRPGLAREGGEEEVGAAFAALDGALLEMDDSLAEGSSFWFTAFSSFMIIFREGLEAVLLIGAILAYLGRTSSQDRHRRQVWAGVALGIGGSVATWIVARTLIPVGGESRELIEGVTALIAVGVLVYVSHWLFQKTYIQDWKAYLQSKVDAAAAGGSALAMAGLAFAAVYREGFETVLFYQALTSDAGAGAVLAGFVPGALLIVAIGWGIIRLGVRLPLRQVFAATNAILLYLAFVFLGKGLYNLQEAGLFAPHPIGGLPEHPALTQLLGFYPTVETLGAQGAFLLIMAVTWLAYRRRAAGRPAEPPAEHRAPEPAVERP